LDGDQEGARRSTAENWSRRDGIRAGSVSGPWRSAPRAEPAAGPAAVPVETIEPETVRRRAPGGSAAVWIALGAVVAAGVIASAAAMLWPDGSAVVETPAAADPAIAAVASVRLRAPESLAPARLDAIVAALREGGVAEVQVEALPFEVETSRVGYYRAPDHAAAEALARVAAPLVTPGAELPVRDYGKLVDDPEPGRLDLWVRN
jgi:hypothetical protein